MSYYYKIIKFLLLLILIGFAGLFALNNQFTLTLDLYPLLEEIRLPAYIALYIGFFLGAGMSMLFFGVEYLSKSVQIRSLHKELGKSNQKVKIEGKNQQTH